MDEENLASKRKSMDEVHEIIRKLRRDAAKVQAELQEHIDDMNARAGRLEKMLEMVDLLSVPHGTLRKLLKLAEDVGITHADQDA